MELYVFPSPEECEIKAYIERCKTEGVCFGKNFRGLKGRNGREAVCLAWMKTLAETYDVAYAHLAGKEENESRRYCCRFLIRHLMRRSK